MDGVDVRDLDPEVLWSRIGLVPQRAFLFTGTIRSNLLHGKPDATDDELWHALEIAQGRDSSSGCRMASTRASRRVVPSSPVVAAALAMQGRREQSGDYPFDDAFSALDLYRPTPPRAALQARDAKVHGRRRGPAGCPHQPRNPILGGRGTDGSSGAGTHEEAARRETHGTRKIVESLAHGRRKCMRNDGALILRAACFPGWHCH